ncbi:T9SS type A sorting domain-containing protein [Flavobacterium humi]|uniref:T9SS type A sorting domain-containing protein n=1 Tax=Flavobacterium humi TaxID=2562683 RepID=A0A4Z0LCU5_9FLAO|nr:T9SS type A sorting domain-containing protein [Flavobacterium humi]TGD59683.1 T9SS type A sorting domain-containing protein [Flavobacterium humi]
MKKTTFFKAATTVFIFSCFSSHSQNLKPFSPRYDADVKGDMLLIGNNILNRKTATIEPEISYNGSGFNSDFIMEYIDIDTDAATFSSSSANLTNPRPGGDNCYKIVYAGLYWGAMLQTGSRADINKVKLKLPTGDYNDITGEIIYDTNLTPIGNDNNKPYACYADVTSLITPLQNPAGTYTVANVLSSEGSNGGTGLSAGWSLVIVYEDLSLSSKSIVTFDGFSGIGGATVLDIPISGFRTIPSGPVNAKFAMAALEGDKPIQGDYLKINGSTISTPERVADNFFNSSINIATGPFTNRIPNSSNTLGYDTGILNINNPANTVIGNNVTSTTIRLGSTQDVYFYYFNAFAVEIIAPKILLSTEVEDLAGSPINTANVGQAVNYVIGFENIGNDNATSFTIKDILPGNVLFNPADLILPPGVSYTYNAATRMLLFTIDNSLVETGDPRIEIIVKVTMYPSCNDYISSCSSFVQNQAFSTYSGTLSSNVFSDEGSTAVFESCNTAPVTPTIFTINLNSCNFTTNETLCGSAVTLVAAEGYQSYNWSGPGTIIPVPGTNNREISVDTAGTYTVNDHAGSANCLSIVETFIVTPCLSTEDIQKDEMKLYPNPVTDIFTITGNMVIENLIIYNPLGQEIISFEGNRKEYVIDQIPSGTYIAKIQAQNGIYIARILKK